MGAWRSAGDVPVSALSSHWHTISGAEALRRADSAPGGLSAAVARARLARDGPNELPPPARTSFWRVLLRQVSSVITLLLLAAAALALVSGDGLDAAAIVAVLVINVTLGLVTELPARRAMHALLSLEVPHATVLRDGRPEQLEARDLVQGDVIVLEAGQAVPADARLVEAVEARTVEAPLTGEAAPVSKDAALILPVATALADRRNMLYRSTTLVDGAARALVVETGKHTEFGRIGTLIGTLPDEATPLERRLAVLGRRLALVALSVAGLVAALGLLQGRGWSEVVQLGLALGIAAVPEGLPVVATVALAIGVRRMARRRALVRRLAIVETLGSTTVVCTDKTGTLTTGEMTATTFMADGREIAVTGAGYTPHGVFHELGAPVDPAERPSLDLALRIGVLASRPEIALPVSGGVPPGDPTEIALVVAAAKGGVEARRARAEAGTLLAQIPFSSSRRFMAAFYRGSDGTLTAYMKGGPGRVLERCSVTDDARREWDETNRSLAARGLRLLGLAYGPVTGTDEASLRGLSFVGFVGLADPPAAGVEDALLELRDAGIRTVMLTGDQRWTAEAIARRLGVSDVFSRVTPEEKLRIVADYQQRGEIVAMLGDGVNDAPALKKADIGVAMGRGADVAKATAGLVLQDDRFGTIAAAVEEGRVIFDNLRKFVFYLFSCNLGEIFVFLGAGLAGWPAPLLPLQILWLNIVTDTFPALALAFEPAEPDLMRRPPRSPRAAILSAGMVRVTAGYALLIALCTLAAAWWGMSRASAVPGHATTLAFMTLAVAQVFHLGNARSEGPVLRPARIVANPYALGAVVLVLILQVIAVQWEPLASVLGVVPLGWRDWLIVGGLGVIPGVVGQVVNVFRRRMSRASGLLVLACVVMMAEPVGAQEVKRLFAPLIADPKQPHFFATVLWVKSPMVTGTLSNVGLGEDLAFASGRNRRWEISVAAGVFSQFNLGTSSIDLINTDFTIGFPLVYRAGAQSLRLKLYHQSSHLGDEFILQTNPTRVNLSFEAIELLASRDFGDVRGYGGGEYIVRHEPADLKPGLLHAGVEFRPSSIRLGSGRLIAAIDGKSSQEREWRVGWSGRVGIEFRVPMQGTTVRRFSVQLHGYTGPAPYGQFYQENVRSLGVGIHLAL